MLQWCCVVFITVQNEVFSCHPHLIGDNLLLQWTVGIVVVVDVVVVVWSKVSLVLFLQNLYSAQIQASSNQRCC